MKIRHNMNVEPAWAASGVQGFFESDKYWYQKVLALCGEWFLFHTFVAKTTTLEKRAGNMPLGKNGISPREWIPKCIVVKWWKRAVLNAVGLSGPGLQNLLGRKLWQKRRKDFFISIMAIESTLEERKEEIRKMVRILLSMINNFHAVVGIQLNVSCPNVGAAYQSIIREAKALLDVINEEDPHGLLTTIVKLVPRVSANEVLEIEKHERCDGFCLGNTLPFGELPDRVDWVSLFGTKNPNHSPLIKRGFYQPGGLSGKMLLPIIYDLIAECRKLGVRKHINACGGILGPYSAWKAMRAGADSISIGSGAILAPWGVLPAILMAHIVTWFRFHFKSWKEFCTALYHPERFYRPASVWARE
jgi:dihydroorotate dehydrogenase